MTTNYKIETNKTFIFFRIDFLKDQPLTLEMLRTYVITGSR